MSFNLFVINNDVSSTSPQYGLKGMENNSNNVVNVQLLLTGNELMTGDIVDSNSAFIAQELLSLGLNVKKKVTVSDDMTDLVSEMKHMSEQADILIINGGLGPTIDDLTAQALAQVKGVEIEQHPDALAHITQWCESKGYKLNEPNLKQTMLPQGCDIIANPVGSAVGIQLELNDCVIYCTPGVPRELKKMVGQEILPDIESRLPHGSVYEVSRYQVFGLGESTLQRIINEQFTDWPTEIDLGFRASMPLLELKLTCTSTSALEKLAYCVAKLHDLLGDHIVAKIEDKPLTLSKHIQSLLTQQNKSITVAESCTGGLIASELTKESGSSSIFEAGFVTYANTMKSAMLSVQNETLNQFGAVSEQTIIEMATGALDVSGADYVIATSGIAGPSGGTEEKPVGTVWIAWGTKQKLQTVCLHVPGHRSFFQHYVAAIALDLVRRELIGSQDVPQYIIDRQRK